MYRPCFFFVFGGEGGRGFWALSKKSLGGAKSPTIRSCWEMSYRLTMPSLNFFFEKHNPKHYCPLFWGEPWFNAETGTGSPTAWKRALNTQADQCMLPAKVLCNRGFFEEPKKPLDMLRTSDPLSLLNEHTLATTHPNNWKAQTTPGNLLLWVRITWSCWSLLYIFVYLR